MRIINSGEAIKSTIPFQQLNAYGVTVVPVSVVYNLKDEDGNMIRSNVPLTFQQNDTSVVVNIDGEYNTLAGDVLKALRVVELVMTDSGGDVFKNYDYYVVRAAVELVVMVNSFQTYEEALLNSVDVLSLAGWNSKDRFNKIVALIESFYTLSRYHYDLSDFSSDRFNYDTTNVYFNDFRRFRLSDLTANQFNTLNSEFLRNIKLAQIAQANYLMDDTDVSKDRRDGLLSHTVGEVSKMYHPRKLLVRPICNPALRYIGRWIQTDVQIVRG